MFSRYLCETETEITMQKITKTGFKDTLTEVSLGWKCFGENKKKLRRFYV